MPGISLHHKGAALIYTFVILVTLTVIALAFVAMVIYETRSTSASFLNMQAFYIAEAGRARARWALTTDGQEVGWSESDISFGNGTYTVTTSDNGDDTYDIVSSGYIPDDTDPIAQRRVEERDVPYTSGESENYSLGATATASSHQGSATPDKSNDGVSTTKWKSSVNNGSWLKHDFGSSATFDKIVYDGTMDSYAVMYSTDDVVYNAVTGASESPAGTVTFDEVSARYLRLDVNGNRPEMNELETYDVGAGEPTLGQGEFVTIW